MLSAPSLQFEYYTVFSEDPALNLPTVPEERPGETAEETRARKAAFEERVRLLELARDTGVYEPILIQGERPTRFKLRSIHGELPFLEGERQRRSLTDGEWAELALRYALVGIDDLGVEFKMEHQKDTNGRRVVHLATIDRLRSIGVDLGQPMLGHRVVTELGLLALKRALEGIPPKR